MPAAHKPTYGTVDARTVQAPPKPRGLSFPLTALSPCLSSHSHTRAPQPSVLSALHASLLPLLPTSGLTRSAMTAGTGHTPRTLHSQPHYPPPSSVQVVGVLQAQVDGVHLLQRAGIQCHLHEARVGGRRRVEGGQGFLHGMAGKRTRGARRVRARRGMCGLRVMQCGVAKIGARGQVGGAATVLTRSPCAFQHSGHTPGSTARTRHASMFSFSCSMEVAPMITAHTAA